MKKRKKKALKYFKEWSRAIAYVNNLTHIMDQAVAVHTTDGVLRIEHFSVSDPEEIKIHPGNIASSVNKEGNDTTIRMETPHDFLDNWAIALYESEMKWLDDFKKRCELEKPA